MSRVLFVSNGHGEISIAARIAEELPGGIVCDHLALVGGEGVAPGARLNEVGPRRAMPSGGLIAMGNVPNILRDLAGGLAAHTVAQLRFLRRARGTYDVAVAVGDVFALLMARRARARATLFAGTAKSVFVAPYGRAEERALAAAQAVFVRDEPTAQRLRDRGIAAHAANVIVDLYAAPAQRELRDGFAPYVAVFPGSREAAYADAVALCAILRELDRTVPGIGATLSVAPGLDAGRMARMLAADGWEVREDAASETLFSLLLEGRCIVRAWRGSLSEMLEGAQLVLGQAGTANEAAAARGIPVVAIEREGKDGWYRRRQAGLLGEALTIVRGDSAAAAREVGALLADAPRLASAGAAGRERMGPAGGAKAIAAEIVRLCG